MYPRHRTKRLRIFCWVSTIYRPGHAVARDPGVSDILVKFEKCLNVVEGMLMSSSFDGIESLLIGQVRVGLEWEDIARKIVSQITRRYNI